MKMFRNIFAIAAIVAAGSFALTGCFDSNPNNNNSDDGKCTALSDCKEGEICNAQGKCVPGKECSDDTDCAQDELCDEELDICVSQYECGDDNPCPEGQTCNIDGVCVDDEIRGVGEDCSADYPCKDGLVCNGDGYCEEPSDEALAYKFVRIDDLYKKGDTNSKEDYGADIDAVILDKGDGQLKYAKDVADYKHGGGFYTGKTEAEIDVASSKILGAPDSFFEYPKVENCHLYINKQSDNATFVSLGGEGGYIIVEMEAAIENGDTLNVLEVGGCKYDDAGENNDESGDAIAEEVKVQISVAKDAVDSQWVVLAEKGKAPLISTKVSDLPAITNSQLQLKN